MVIVRRANGKLVSDKQDVNMRWNEYSEGLLSVSDEREADVACLIGGGVWSVRVMVSGVVKRKELVNVLHKTKGGEATGMDGNNVEFLQQGGDGVVEWILGLVDVYRAQREVPEDWQNAHLAPLYKGKVDKIECSCYRSISLSITGKVYGRVMVRRMVSFKK